MLKEIPVQFRDAIVKSLEEAIVAVRAGQLGGIALVLVDRNFATQSAATGESGTVIARMIEAVNQHFTCQCGKPNCPTDATHAQIAAIIKAYFDHDPSVPQVRN